MANPFLVLGGIAISVATAAFGILQVPGWVAGAQDAAAINDMAQVAQAQAAVASQTGSYRVDMSDTVKITPSQGVAQRTAVSVDGGRWATVAVSQSGRVFVRASDSTATFTQERAYAPGDSLSAVTAPEGVTVGGTASSPHITVGNAANYTAWAVSARNSIRMPNPATYSGSGWAVARANGTSDPAGGIAATYDDSVAWTPYIHTNQSVDSYKAGDQVTLAVTYRVDESVSDDITGIRVVGHVKSTNAIINPTTDSIRPMVIGKTERVVLHLTLTQDIAAGDLDISVYPTRANGAYGSATFFKWAAREPVIERGHTTGTFFAGDSAPPNELTRYRWEGTPGASASLRETRTVAP